MEHVWSACSQLLQPVFKGFTTSSSDTLGGAISAESMVTLSRGEAIRSERAVRLCNVEVATRHREPATCWSIPNG